jgi:hypothetical protein
MIKNSKNLLTNMRYQFKEMNYDDDDNNISCTFSLVYHLLIDRNQCQVFCHCLYPLLLGL